MRGGLLLSAFSNFLAMAGIWWGENGMATPASGHVDTFYGQWGLNVAHISRVLGRGFTPRDYSKLKTPPPSPPTPVTPLYPNPLNQLEFFKHHAQFKRETFEWQSGTPGIAEAQRPRIDSSYYWERETMFWRSSWISWTDEARRKKSEACAHWRSEAIIWKDKCMLDGVNRVREEIDDPKYWEIENAFYETLQEQSQKEFCAKIDQRLISSFQSLMLPHKQIFADR